MSAMPPPAPVPFFAAEDDYGGVLRRGLEQSRREKGEDHEETLAHLAALAAHFDQIGQPEAARPFAEEHARLAASHQKKPDGAREARPMAGVSFGLASNPDVGLQPPQPYSLGTLQTGRATPAAPLGAKATHAGTDADPSLAHPGSNADRAAALNIEYQAELARWKALSWWQRKRTKKPMPPTRI